MSQTNFFKINKKIKKILTIMQVIVQKKKNRNNNQFLRERRFSDNYFGSVMNEVRFFLASVSL